MHRQDPASLREPSHVPKPDLQGGAAAFHFEHEVAAGPSGCALRSPMHFHTSTTGSISLRQERRPVALGASAAPDGQSQWPAALVPCLVAGAGATPARLRHLR